MIFNAFSAVLTAAVLIALGVFTARAKWCTPDVPRFLSKFLVNITLPCTVVSSFITRLSDGVLGGAGIMILASFCALISAFALAAVIVRAGKVRAGRRGVFCSLFAFSNSVYIGLPVATAIFGDAAIPFALFYYVANTCLANSIGYFMIERDGAVLRGSAARSARKFTGIAKRILTPPLLAVAAGFVLTGLSVRLPEFLTMSLRYAGNITSPLALIFVGMILKREGLSKLKKIDKDTALAMIGRFIIAPGLMVLSCAAFGITGLGGQVLCVQSALPAMVGTSLFAEAAGADADFAAKGMAFSTLLSFAALPAAVYLSGVLMI